jgi:ferric-dicitrate binding protein FerR (iron transport regulator)
MKNIQERIAYLILLFLLGELSSQDRRELDAWILKSKENELAFAKAITITDRLTKTQSKKLAREANQQLVRLNNSVAEIKALFKRSCRFI